MADTKIDFNKIKMISGENKFKDYFNEIAQRYDKESSRGVVILVNDLFNVMLAELLIRRLVNNEKLIRELADIDRITLEVKIKLCYLSGILSYDEYDDLLNINKIRNRFAHVKQIKRIDSLSIIKNFEDSEVASLVKSLKIQEKIKTLPYLNFKKSDTRQKFIMATSVLFLYLHDRLAKIVRISEYRYEANQGASRI